MASVSGSNAASAANCAGVGAGQVDVLGELLDLADVARRRDHPAEAPAGHVEVLREAVDHEDVVAHFQRRARLAFVDEAVIDLVDDERAAPRPHETRQRARGPRAR